MFELSSFNYHLLDPINFLPFFLYRFLKRSLTPVVGNAAGLGWLEKIFSCTCFSCHSKQADKSLLVFSLSFGIMLDYLNCRIYAEFYVITSYV